MSHPDHTWRLYGDFGAEDITEFEIAAKLSALLPPGEHVDHWFDHGRSIYGGFSYPPQDNSIQKRLCFICEGWGWGCVFCCNTGYTYHWAHTPSELIQASIDGLQRIVDDLSGDHELI